MMLRRKTLRIGIKVDRILERVGIYAVPVAWRWNRAKTRNHAVRHEVAVVQTTFVQGVQSVIQMQVLGLSVLLLLLLLLEDLQVILSLLAERSAANGSRRIR
jgi:cobalamin biosynthesis protein CobD/CbiB